jgi:hypothetical protein
MKTVANKTHEPIRIPLGDGHVLHLDAHGRGQISDRAAESRFVRTLLEQDRIEILAGDQPRAPRPPTGRGRGASTQGHHPPVSSKRRGDR